MFSEFKSYAGGMLMVWLLGIG